MSIHNLQASSIRKDFIEPSVVCAPRRKPKLVYAAPQLVSRTKKLSIQCGVQFRPCIDIHKGKVKQIVGSTLQDSKEGESGLITNYESDKSAAEYAQMYKDDGLTGGHVIMLGADTLSQSAAIEALHAYPGGLQVGGGINSSNALSYIDEGASHVIVTSYVFSNGQVDFERLKELAHAVGRQRLVLDLSCRKKEDRYAVVTDRWQKFTDVYLDKKVLDFLANYADEFLVHGVDVEGKKLGIDEELVALLGRHSPFSASLILELCMKIPPLLGFVLLIFPGSWHSERSSSVGTLLQWQYVFSNGQVDFERLKELAHAVGRQRLVLDLSYRKKVNNLPKDVAFVTRTKAAWIVFYFVSV
ncbi:UNVERIFIED_CONTAM: 1-(5-phosphoribosyl)-5-[(5-phosphoribosylamino)methylideneamino] imidazole-4-carboxamide isomerase [Sesamum angustifolium]|uniref:1-(5-phosphoribosyl)-5-[(5-phosphoribosylamino)methylideneamino] imidazole-4-carboxamide isomerase HISN3, chloroplastic n=1 Tax=Sesamum angustifolium TaxID=2727405 RepID=A0AAW2N6Z2_9LAMI